MDKITLKIETTEPRKNWLFVCTSKCTELGITTEDVDLIIINGERKEFSWILENDSFWVNGLTTHISEFE